MDYSMFLKKFDNLVIIENLLSKYITNPNDPIIKEDLFLLFTYPLMVMQEVASCVDGEKTLNLIQQGLEAENKNDIMLMAKISKDLQHLMVFASNPLAPHLEEWSLFNLVPLMTSYILLNLTLTNYLISGDFSHRVLWPYVKLEEFVKAGDNLQFTYIVADTWRKIHLTLTRMNLDEISSRLGKDGYNIDAIEREYRIAPFMVLMEKELSNKRNRKSKLDLISSGFHVAIHSKGYKFIEIFLRLPLNSDLIHYDILPQWDKDHPFRGMILTIMADLARSIRANVRDIRMAWKNFLNLPENFAMHENEDKLVLWIKRLLENDHSTETLMSNRQVMRCLANLDREIDVDQIKEISVSVRKVFRNYIPAESMKILREVDDEVQSLFRATKYQKSKKENSAKDYFKNHPLSFKHLTKDMVGHIAKHFVDNAANGRRDAQRYALGAVFKKRYGREMPSCRIEQKLKAHE